MGADFQAGTQKIDDNLRLRDRLRQNDETLTDEERKRAEILLQRDVRKAEQRAERSKRRMVCRLGSMMVRARL